MSASSAQADAFYREVAEHRRVWTVRYEGGIPAPMVSGGRRAMPFWSLGSRAEKVIANVEAYAGFEPVEITWEDFRDAWLPGLERDGLLVGVNWSGPNATGYDLEPQAVRKSLEYAFSQLDDSD